MPENAWQLFIAKISEGGMVCFAGTQTALRLQNEIERQHINHNNNKKLIFIVSYVYTCHIFALKVII